MHPFISNGLTSHAGTDVARSASPTMCSILLVHLYICRYANAQLGRLINRLSIFSTSRDSTILLINRLSYCNPMCHWHLFHTCTCIHVYMRDPLPSVYLSWKCRKQMSDWCKGYLLHYYCIYIVYILIHNIHDCDIYYGWEMEI